MQRKNKQPKKQQSCFIVNKKISNKLKVKKTTCGIKIAGKYTSILILIMSTPLNTPYRNIFLLLFKTSLWS